MLRGLKKSFFISFFIFIFSLYRKFVKPREFIKKLLARIRQTRHLVHYTGKFVISRVHYAGIKLYIYFSSLSTEFVLMFKSGEKLDNSIT